MYYIVLIIYIGYHIRLELFNFLEKNLYVCIFLLAEAFINNIFGISGNSTSIFYMNGILNTFRLLRKWFSPV